MSQEEPLNQPGGQGGFHREVMLGLILNSWGSKDRRPRKKEQHKQRHRVNRRGVCEPQASSGDK